MKKLWDLKNIFSNLELEGQGLCHHHRSDTPISARAILHHTDLPKRTKHFDGECTFGGFKMYLTWGVWISHLYSSWSNKAVPALPLPFALNSFVTVRGSSRGIDTVISISFGIGQNVVIVGQTRIYIIEWKELKIEWFYVMYVQQVFEIPQNRSLCSCGT